MKSKNYLRLILPIFIGVSLGLICKIVNFELPVRIALTFSDNILVLMKFITPFLLFSITAYALSSIKDNKFNKFKFLIKLSIIIVSTLSVLAIIAFILSINIVPTLTFNFNSESGELLHGLFKIPLPSIITSSYTSIVCIILGILCGIIFDEDHLIIKFCLKLQNLIFFIFTKIIFPITPIWIIGSFASTTFSNIGLNFILTDLLLSIFILILQFSWLFAMYFVTSKLFDINFKRMCHSGLDIFLYVVSIFGMGTQVVIPFIIDKQKQLNINEKKATIITATSFNMPGSLISNIVLIVGVIDLFNFNVDFITLFLFIFILILATIIAPSFPGGTGAITSSLAASFLGFNDEMVSIFYTMYHKQGVFNAAINNSADLYIGAFFKNKIENKKDSHL